MVESHAGASGNGSQTRRKIMAEEKVEEQVSDDNSQVTPEVEQLQKEIEGLKTGLRDESQKRQERENEIGFYKGLIEKQAEPQSEEIEDDEWVSAKQVKGMVESQVAELKKTFQTQKTAGSIKAAKDRYPDYDEILGYTEKMIAQNPDLVGVIEGSNDPAEMAVALGKTHPDYTAKAVKEASKKTAEKIKENAEKPSTLDDISGGGSQALDELQKMQSMSDEDLEKMIHKIKME